MTRSLSLSARRSNGMLPPGASTLRRLPRISLAAATRSVARASATMTRAVSSALCVLLPLLSWGCSKDDDTPARTPSDGGATGGDTAMAGDAATGGGGRASGGSAGSAAATGGSGVSGAPATTGGASGDTGGATTTGGAPVGGGAGGPPATGGSGGSVTTGGALVGGAAGGPPATAGTDVAGGAAGSAATTGGTDLVGGAAGATATGGSNTAGAGGEGAASATAGAAGSSDTGNGGSAGSGATPLDCTWTTLNPVDAEYGTGRVDDDGAKYSGNINVYTSGSRGFLKFDLSSLDADAEVMAVTLTLRLESTDAETEEPVSGSRIYPLVLDPTTADGSALYEDCEDGDVLWSGEWDFGGSYSNVAVEHDLNEAGLDFVQGRLTEGWAGFGIAHRSWWYEFYGDQSPRLGVCVAN